MTKYICPSCSQNMIIEEGVASCYTLNCDIIFYYIKSQQFYLTDDNGGVKMFIEGPFKKCCKYFKLRAFA